MMSKLGPIARVATIGANALLFAASLSAAEEGRHYGDADNEPASRHDIPIIPQAQVVKSGVVRVMELEERGWTYVKP
jgi:hypothetical protein